MSKKIISPREEYTEEKAREFGLFGLFYEFQKRFVEYVEQRSTFGNLVLPSLFPNLPDSENPFNDFVQNTPNFNRYVGDLERACHAAQTIGKDYDFGMGVAKKGLWSSFIFNLHGLPTHDGLVIRTGEGKRLMLPISPLYRKDIKGSKILLFDNDLVTGNTIDAIVGEIRKLEPKHIDLLLIYENAYITPEFYEQVKDSFKGEPKIVGEMEDGRIVLETSCEVPKKIRRSMSLNKDFDIDRKRLVKLAQILGVEYGR